MAKEDLVLFFDKPHFVVKLHKDLLEVDFKKGVRKELEDALEAKPFLRESLGLIFQTAIPLDVALKEIESVTVDNEGRVKIVIPLKKDIIIPLKSDESKKLVEKLNELIPIEKENEIKRLLAARREAKKVEVARWEVVEAGKRERLHAR